MLEERYGPKKFVATNSGSNPSDFSAQLAKFLDHMSGVDGAEYPGYCFISFIILALYLLLFKV
jgi:hypothetical protein